MTTFLARVRTNLSVFALGGVLAALLVMASVAAMKIRNDSQPTFLAQSTRPPGTPPSNSVGPVATVRPGEPFAGLRLVTARFEMEPYASEERKVACASGETAIGGGYTSNPDVSHEPHTRSFSAQVNDILGTLVPDGWKIEANLYRELVGERYVIYVWVACSK